MTGVEADADALAPARRRDQLGCLFDLATEGPAPPGGVLEVDGTPLALGKRLADRLAGAGDRALYVAGLGRSGVEDHPTRADSGANAQRVDQRCERLRADLSVVAGAVDQVDGMDHHRLDRARRHRLAECQHVLLAVDGGLPHAP